MFLPLDGDGPLHRQTYRALRGAILEGRLRPGERLAATRVLARDMGVSRNTVLQAYDQLLAEGYVSARGGSGTYVADARPGQVAAGPSPRRGNAAPAAETLSAAARRLAAGVPSRHATWSLGREALPYDFRYGEPAYNDLPLAAWARILGRRARRVSVRRLAYQPPGGAAELRQALSPYLARARGVRSTPEQIVIVHGSQQAIDLTVRLLVDAGDRAVLEEPHYTGFSFCLTAAGAEIDYVPVDEHGLDTGRLEAIRQARLVCVTPSHQFPAGGVMPLPRRLALLEWARARSAYVLEDDYDGEFRYEGRPLECLQALDRDGRVIYAGTASKILFPALRIGWLIAPPALVPLFQAAKALADTGTASLEQLAFADFVAEGHLERHVRRSRAKHAARRQALLEALRQELGERAHVLGASAGLHVLLRIEELPRGESRHLRDACRELGVGVYPAEPFYARPPSRLELLLGYASLDPKAIREGVRRLRRALDKMEKK